MKNTKQKKGILDIINNSNNHLDAYQIYDEARKQIYNISLGTVYRNLGGLENDNLIISLMVNGVKHYDKVIPHYHFICKKCCVMNKYVVQYLQVTGQVIGLEHYKHY